MPNLGKRSATPEEMLEYLQTHAYKEGDCLIWAGGKAGGEYPVVMWRGKKYVAQRLLVTLLGRCFRPGQYVYAVCGNRACMNSQHLRVSTKTDVSKNSYKHGRYPTGTLRGVVISLARQRKGDVKLPIKERSTLLRLRGEGYTYAQIAEKYGVHPSAVGYALKTWAKLYGDM